MRLKVVTKVCMIYHVYYCDCFYLKGPPPTSEINDAHARGKADVALQATRTRRSGSLCEP